MEVKFSWFHKDIIHCRESDPLDRESIERFHCIVSFTIRLIPS